MEKYIEKFSELAVDFAPKVVQAILVLIIGLWIINLLTRVVRNQLKKRNVDEAIHPFLCSIINVGLKVMLLLSVAAIFGVQTTSFVAVLGALAFAVGMALQGSLGHFASGVLLIVFKPYKVGDLVEISGKTGVVEAIQVFNTILLTPDNKKIIIPNGVVTSGHITNISGQGEIRVDMTYGIGYTDDIDKAKAIILHVAKACPQIFQDRPVDIFVSELADSSVNFAVRPWCKSEHYWDVYFFMHEQIKKAFDDKGISIPYPQMDVHMQK